MFEKIKKWYTLNLWTKAMVAAAFEKGVLTEEQMQNILLVDR